ncbi:MAG: transporter substrate-binding domain-containing protein [Acidobacteria bacterium]|nr:transporter substrate-binding domain-containing protein [Acidobacteriota bacterium]
MVRMRFFILPLILLAACVLHGCRTGPDGESDEDSQTWRTTDYPEIRVDLQQIRERGKLIAITSYSSTSYFLYRGKPMGYEYELLKNLSEYLGLDLEIKIARNMNKIIDMLLRGEGDIISYGMAVTRERREKMAFTKYHTKTHQVLVQRKPAEWRNMRRHEIEESLIRDPLELIGKTVHVRRDSAYYGRLKNLMEEIGGDIHIQTVKGNLETEELIQMVANGEIDYTVADYNIAAINATYYENIDIDTGISFNQRIAWALRTTSPELLGEINAWIEKMRKESDYYVIYNRYFKNDKAFRRRIRSEYFSGSGSRISKYDELLKEKAEELSWDWRLLASLIYQESRFDPEVESWAGAVGLMQIMPITAEHLGVDGIEDPAENIDAGVRFLKELQRTFEDIPDPEEKIKFILASYNVGPGHIEDARRLAEKYGNKGDVWTGEVELWIRKKSQSKYYNDEVVQYGYCRGIETYRYVREVMERYHQYRLFIS